MAWRVEFEPRALQELRKLDRQMQTRIIRFLEQRISHGTDPRSSGKPLRGEKAGLWRYRIGDYRIVCEIRDKNLVVIVVRVAHRREVYR